MLRASGLTSGQMKEKKMRIEQAKTIAKKYVKDELEVLKLTRDIITAYNEGYKDAHHDMTSFLNRDRK